MKIRYIGKARIRVEGVGDFEPGDERDVKDAVAGELCRGGEFREVKAKGHSSPLPEGDGATGRKRGNRKNGANEPAADDAANDQTAADDAATREE